MAQGKGGRAVTHGAATGHAPAQSFLRRHVFSVDHKVIGRQYLDLALESAADVTYAYDESGTRVLKTATDGANSSVHTAEIFNTLRLNHAAWPDAQGDYERAGMPPFRPYGARGGAMRYFEVPLDVLESSVDLVRWARKAIAVAESQRRD